MIDVIQVFRSEQRFKKDNYETAKLLHQWEDYIASRNGYLEDGTLYLPDTGDKAPAIEDAKIFVIVDIKGFQPFSAETSRKWTRAPHWHVDTHKKYMLYVNDQIIGGYKQAGSLNLGFLKIEKEQAGSFNLHLHYSRHPMEIGVPERDDHMFANVKTGKAVRYRLNGKSDFTMSGRKARGFAEFDFIIEYSGQAEKVVFEQPAKIETVKKPTKEYKLVDERKILK
jgi:hypothetical protein